MKYRNFPEKIYIDYDCGCRYYFYAYGQELECVYFCEEHDPTIVGGEATIFKEEDDTPYSTSKKYQDDEEE